MAPPLARLGVNLGFICRVKVNMSITCTAPVHRKREIIDLKARESTDCRSMGFPAVNRVCLYTGIPLHTVKRPGFPAYR